VCFEALAKEQALCEGGSEEECAGGKKMMLSLQIIVAMIAYVANKAIIKWA
jgi:hypothetical protein